MSIRPSRCVLPVVFGLALGAAALAARDVPRVNVNRAGVAVKGYDVVAYVTVGKPIQGREEFETTWNGVTWRFASASNRESFGRDPEKFAPMFGGYCAWAVSRNYTADADPEAWTIVNGRLYLNYSKRVQAMWARDIPGNIARGTANWPAVLQK